MKLLSVALLSTAAGLLAPMTTGGDGVNGHSNSLGQVVMNGQKTIKGGGSGDGGVGSNESETVSSYDDDECGPDRSLIETFTRPVLGRRWVLIDAGCGGTATIGDREILTPDVVLRAVKRIGLPRNRVEVPSQTLVNFETTVYTEPTDFARTITLLGYAVDVRAHPSRFAWHFGDGTTMTTSTPGAPYPSDEITHTWMDAHRTFRLRVDTTYTVSYRVDGGPWLDLGDTVTVSGVAGSVRVREATPVLS